MFGKKKDTATATDLDKKEALDSMEQRNSRGSDDKIQIHDADGAAAASAEPKKEKEGFMSSLKSTARGTVS